MKVFSLMVLTLLLACMLAFDIRPVEAEHATIVVPDDYGTIQQAIDAASPGTTVFVRRGIYRENLFISKSLDLIGEDMERTVIDGSGTGHVIYIKADSVKVSGFTITNSSLNFPYSGIHLDDSHNCNIHNNKITESYYGIRVYNSSDNLIHQNHIYAAYIHARSTYLYTIELAWSHRNTIMANHLYHGAYGIIMAESRNNSIAENTFVPGSGADEAVRVEHNSNYNTFLSNNITINKVGYREYSFRIGFYISGSLGNVLRENEITTRDCIYLSKANMTVMLENDLYGTTRSLYIEKSHYCVFYHNNIFVGSVGGLYDLVGNVWGNGYPSGGNYWKMQTARSDYYSGSNQDEPGSDGIVDTPYQLGRYDEDRYPFMNPYAEPTFIVSSSPTSQKLYAPHSKSTTILITSINSFILPVHLSYSWVGTPPSGVTCSLSQNTVTPPPNGIGITNLTISAAPTASIGTFTLRVTGTSNSLTHYRDIPVTILSASLDITPPQIGKPAQKPHKNIIELNETVTITVNATDEESGIDKVTLSYTTDNGTTWTNLTMNLNITTNSYATIIPEQQPSTIVKYKIIAYDNAGNMAVADNAGQYYIYTVIPEFSLATILALFIILSMLVVVFAKKKPPKKTKTKL